MRTYVRARVEGGTYFFTVNLAKRHGTTLLVDRIDALKEAFRRTRQDHPFAMPAFVVLPEHLHCIWRLPPGDDDFPRAMAPYQITLLTQPTQGRTTDAKPRIQKRARNLAAPLLGTTCA